MLSQIIGNLILFSSYYHCANGRPYAGSCPAGLLWNGVKQECDFPENVNCEVSIGEAARFKVNTSTWHCLIEF